MAFFSNDTSKCIVIVFAAFCIIGISDGINYLIGIYVSYWINEMKITRFQLDWIGSLQLGLAFCLSPINAKLILKLGLQAMPAIGGLICSISYVICSFTAHFSMLYIFYGILPGIGIGMAYMSAVVSITLNFEERRPIAMGIITCGTGVGASFMSAILPRILQVMPWRTSMYILASLTITLCLFGLMLMQRKSRQTSVGGACIIDRTQINLIESGFFRGSIRLPPQFLGSYEAMNSTLTLANLINHKHVNHYLGNLGSFVYMAELDKLISSDLREKRKRFHLFFKPEFVLLLIASLLVSLTCMPPIVYLFDWLRQKNITDDTISGILSINGISGAISRLSVGFIATFQFCKKVPFTLFWLLLCGTSTIICTFMSKSYEYALFSSIYGLCTGAFVVLQPLVLTEIISKDDLTDGLSILLLSSGLGYLVGTPLMTLVYDNWKNYSICYQLCGCVVICAALLISVIWIISSKKSRQDQRELTLRRLLENEMNTPIRTYTSSTTSTP